MKRTNCKKTLNPITGVIFKHEDKTDGIPIGPTWVRYANGTVVRIGTSDFGTPIWYPRSKAQELAKEWGVEIEEA